MKLFIPSCVLKKSTKFFKEGRGEVILMFQVFWISVLGYLGETINNAHFRLLAVLRALNSQMGNRWEGYYCLNSEKHNYFNHSHNNKDSYSVESNLFSTFILLQQNKKKLIFTSTELHLCIYLKIIDK